MKTAVITGGSGYLGAWVIKEFLEHDYEVINIDIKRSAERRCRTILADLTNHGDVYSALKDTNANVLVNLAAIPAAYIYSDEVTVRTNVLSTYSVLEAAAALGIEKVALASSDSTYGIVFSKKSVSPIYVPIDEDHPQLPDDPYGFSKMINEETARLFNRKTGNQIVCLRFVHIAMPDHYASYPSFNRDISNKATASRAKELWNYVDARDAASACRCAVEADGLDACAFNISADDTCMDIETNQLLSVYYPEVKHFKCKITGYDSITTNHKAKKMMAWSPLHSWRDSLDR